jgi:hypothetical protein
VFVATRGPPELARRMGGVGGRRLTARRLLDSADVFTRPGRSFRSPCARCGAAEPWPSGITMSAIPSDYEESSTSGACGASSRTLRRDGEEPLREAAAIPIRPGHDVSWSARTWALLALRKIGSTALEPAVAGTEGMVLNGSSRGSHTRRAALVTGAGGDHLLPPVGARPPTPSR